MRVVPGAEVLKPDMVSFVRFKELAKKRLKVNSSLRARILEEADQLPRIEAIAKSDVYMRLMDSLPDDEFQA